MNIDEKTRPADPFANAWPEETIAHEGEHDNDLPVRFDAVLQPQSSLGPRGFLFFMAAFGTISFIAGVAFVMVGAWPVFGFMGLDILLVYLAFRINFRDSRRFETLRLTDESLIVIRVAADGQRRRFRFQPYWLQVVLEEIPGANSALLLRSHGKELEIGSFLTYDEKLDLALALRAELERMKQHSDEG